eukprot:2236451-Pyramimonas_sp.AAC.1
MTEDGDYRGNRWAGQVVGDLNSIGSVKGGEELLHEFGGKALMVFTRDYASHFEQLDFSQLRKAFWGTEPILEPSEHDPPAPPPPAEEPAVW